MRIIKYLVLRNLSYCRNAIDTYTFPIREIVVLSASDPSEGAEDQRKERQRSDLKKEEIMANDMLKFALVALQELDAKYREAYKAVTDNASPKRKAWNEALEAQHDTVDVPDFGSDIVEAAQESDSAVFVSALLAQLDEVRGTLKSYMDTLFVAENKGNTDGLMSVDDMSTLHDDIRTKFNALTAMVDAGFLTQADISAFVPTRMTEPRKTKGGGTAPPRFVWNSPGKVQGTRGAQVRTNSVTRQLLVDGETVEGKTLGEQCMKSGIHGFTVGKFQKLVEDAGHNFTDPKTYSSWSVEVDGKVLSLRLK